jgi:hypothetical protein
MAEAKAETLMLRCRCGRRFACGEGYSDPRSRLPGELTCRPCAGAALRKLLKDAEDRRKAGEVTASGRETGD